MRGNAKQQKNAFESAREFGSKDPPHGHIRTDKFPGTELAAGEKPRVDTGHMRLNKAWTVKREEEVAPVRAS